MMLPYNTSARVLSCGLMVCSLTVGVTSAANIEITKHLEIGAAATDNPALIDADAPAEQVFNVKPSVQLKFAGNRFGATAVAEVEYYRFNDAEEEVFDPRLSTRIRGTLIDNLVFLDTSLVISKLSADNNFLRLADKDGPTAAVFKAKTYLDRSFGRAADFYLAHTYSTLAEEAGEDFGSDQNTIDFSLGRNPKYGGVIWGLGGFYSQDNSTQNEFENSSLFGKLGTTFAQTFLAELTLGVETEDFILANTTTQNNDSATVWQANLTWSPSELTTLSLGYGERFFGEGPSLLLRHKVRNSTFEASYTRDITRQSAALNNISTLSDNPNTNPTIVDTDAVTISNGNLVTPLSEPYIDNQFRLSYKLAGRRSDIIVDAVYSEQERLTGGDTIDTLLGRIVFDRRLSEFLLLRLQYDYQQSEASNLSNLNYKENRFAVKFIYHFDGVSQFEDDEFEIE